MTSAVSTTFPGRSIGYARVSPDDQQLDRQRDALASAGCVHIFEDQGTGVRTFRPGLAAALSELKPGDTLVIWRLDRLGRTTHQLLSLFERFERDDIQLHSLQDRIDPRTILGRAIVQTGALLARMERDLTREHACGGLASARSRGRSGGRPSIVTASKLDEARQLMADRDLTMEEIAGRIGVSRTTLYRALVRAEAVAPSNRSTDAERAIPLQAQFTAPRKEYENA